MASSSSPDGPRSDDSPIREVILSVFEDSLQAQLSALRRLRAGKPPLKGPDSVGNKRRTSGRSHIDLAFDILAKAQAPLHISALLERIEAAFGRKIDSESLVSALSKRVARKDRFRRTAPNTFALLNS